MSNTSGGYYFAPPSHWPVVGSIALFFLAVGGVMLMNSIGGGIIPFAIGFFTLVYMLFGWFGTVIRESEGGLFNKQVDNFIVNQQTEHTVGNLRDPSAGPRYAAALADVIAGGGSADDVQAIMDQININMGRPIGTPITQQDDDPLAVFRGDHRAHVRSLFEARRHLERAGARGEFRHQAIAGVADGNDRGNGHAALAG